MNKINPLMCGMKNINLSILIMLLLVFISCSKHVKLNIVPLSPFEATGNDKPQSKAGTWKTKYYIIKNYSDEDLTIDKIVQDFVMQKLDANYQNFNQYSILLYKESDKLNEHFRNSPENRIEWYGQDLVYSFIWFNGKMSNYIKYKDGFPQNVPNSEEIK